MLWMWVSSQVNFWGSHPKVAVPMLPSRIPKPAQPRQPGRLVMGPSTSQPTGAQALLCRDPITHTFRPAKPKAQ